MLQSAHTASLKVHEWIAVAVLISSIFTLSLVTHFSDSTTASPFPQPHDHHEIVIKGAVAYPGIYRIPSDMPLQEALTLAGVSPQANLSRFKLDNPVKKGRVLHIPLKRAKTPFSRDKFNAEAQRRKA